jgi:hypothetical protein
MMEDLDRETHPDETEKGCSDEYRGRDYRTEDVSLEEMLAARREHGHFRRGSDRSENTLWTIPESR